MLQAANLFTLPLERLCSTTELLLGEICRNSNVYVLLYLRLIRLSYFRCGSRRDLYLQRPLDLWPVQPREGQKEVRYATTQSRKSHKAVDVEMRWKRIQIVRKTIVIGTTSLDNVETLLITGIFYHRYVENDVDEQNLMKGKANLVEFLASAVECSLEEAGKMVRKSPCLTSLIATQAY